MTALFLKWWRCCCVVGVCGVGVVVCEWLAEGEGVKAALALIRQTNKRMVSEGEGVCVKAVKALMKERGGEDGEC